MSTKLSVLVPLAHRGDRAAFGELVQATRHVVYAIALSRVGDARLSEDIAQDVFVEVWSKLDQLRNPDSFLPWLRQIARNRSTDRLRVHRDHEEIPSSLPDPDRDPEEDLATRERAVALQHALDGMDADEREVLVLYYLEEQSSAQVARLLGISEPAVRKRLSRARQRLRDQDDVLILVQRGALPVGFWMAVERRLPEGRAWSRWAVAGGGLVALGLFGWLGLKESGPPASSNFLGPRPAQTVAGSASLTRARTPPPMPSEQAVATAEAIQAVDVAVRLGGFEDVRGPIELISMFATKTFFPTADEVPWPDEPELEWILELTGQPVEASKLTEDQRDGLRWRVDNPSDDPWGALIDLEAARLLESQRWFSAARAHDQDVDQPMPVHDNRVVRARIADLEARWPDHPVVDYALLYELNAARDDFVGSRDGRTLALAALDVFEQTDDALLWNQAAGLLGTAGRGAQLSADELHTLVGLRESIETPAGQFNLARTATVSALENGDFVRGRYWLEAWNEALVRMSDPERPERIEPLTEARDQAGSWLAMHGHGQPPTWQSALGWMARRCHAEGRGPQAELHGSGTWDGAWSWTHWTPSGDATACLEEQTHEGPTPPAGTPVELTILPPR